MISRRPSRSIDRTVESPGGVCTYNCMHVYMPPAGNIQLATTFFFNAKPCQLAAVKLAARLQFLNCQLLQFGRLHHSSSKRAHTCMAGQTTTLSQINQLPLILTSQCISLFLILIHFYLSLSLPFSFLHTTPFSFLFRSCARRAKTSSVMGLREYTTAFG